MNIVVFNVDGTIRSIDGRPWYPPFWRARRRQPSLCAQAPVRLLSVVHDSRAARLLGAAS